MANRRGKGKGEEDTILEGLLFCIEERATEAIIQGGQQTSGGERHWDHPTSLQKKEKTRLYKEKGGIR